MTMGCLKHTKMLLVSYLIILAILLYFPSGQAEATNGNESKVTSPGGYTHLQTKSQNKGSVKIIVRIRAPFTPESRLQERDKHAQRTSTVRAQNQVVTELESKGHKPGRVRKYKYVPYIAMTVDSSALDALLSSPDVISVEEDIPVPHTLDQSVPRIGATQLHTGSVTGAGIAVAVLDTGVDKTHPFLQGSVISEACYSSNANDPKYDSSSLCPGGVEESEAVGSAMPYGGNCPLGDCDHGTHVAGIVAGRSGIGGSPGPGVAPEAGIIAIQVFSRIVSLTYCGSSQPCVLSWSSDQLSGLERVYELQNTYSIASVNMSLGGGQYSGYCDSNSLKDAIDNLRTNGIATVIASGNNGYCGSISAPACISSAISVGATTDSDTVAPYSNSASFMSLLAPGSSIKSSVPGDIYQSYNGTSMATPHVAGAWALMKQDSPAATVDDILSAFTSTGLSVTDIGCKSVTKKRINVYEAYGLVSDYVSLTISKTGVGTVMTDPSGIDCGDFCSAWFPRGTPVTLTASADPGSVFAGWSDGGCPVTGAYQLTLTEHTTIKALFVNTDNYTRVTMVFPNGGEILHPGQECTAIWGGPSTVESYKLYYSFNNGSTWKPITTQPVAGTSISWTIPGVNKNTGTCRTKVVGYSGATKIGTDKSHKPFMIEVVKLTSPNGGGPSFSSGQDITVTWTTFDTINPVDQVQLYYSLDKGSTWKSFLSQPLHSNPGSYVVNLPPVTKTKSNCKVKVILKDAAGKKLGADTSDGVFTINP